ncbi:MAG: cysteine--tRNA ligase [Candidatus Obscuribacter phosphatis]|uniref:Cysteine--tRNA ligase n=1 Tax=Candidatus Obscuribacter phosphatis TaxID=1906157 RepID=A0A8J7TPG1_9BACT|nr:cysteine--tRNA ligase [Candidatus Obscuribacter phosphatis]
MNSEVEKIQVFNTLTGKKEDFVPVSGKTVKIYACGPTVYDSSHLGHARKEIVWDTVQRYLRFVGYDVIYVRNITDVDDKIINRAKERGIGPDKLAREYTFAFWEDMHALNVQAPDFEPRATEFIAQMISFVEGLIKAGHAYQAGGDVYFDVGSFNDYGKLGKKNLDELMVGAREQVVAQEELQKLKKNAVDFALWKSADKDELGWQSPWGYGRPGWHLECSTMVKHILGETIDIHSGGEDLVFPHHENEIAQSEALHKHPLARYWLHNGFIQVSQEKMAKSLGNFKTIKDLLHEYEPDAIRLFVLQTHYRNPIDFSPESLAAVKSGLQRLVRAAHLNDGLELKGAAGKDILAAAEKFKAEFRQAMNNDFNTAIAISHLYQIADQISALKDKESAARQVLIDVLLEHAAVLGLTLLDNRKNLKDEQKEKLVGILLEMRQKAKADKDFERADAIRKQLTDIGIAVMDTPQGATWETI